MIYLTYPEESSLYFIDMCLINFRREVIVCR